MSDEEQEKRGLSPFSPFSPRFPRFPRFPIGTELRGN